MLAGAVAGAAVDLALYVIYTYTHIHTYARRRHACRRSSWSCSRSCFIPSTHIQKHTYSHRSCITSYIYTYIHMHAGGMLAVAVAGNCSRSCFIPYIHIHMYILYLIYTHTYMHTYARRRHACRRSSWSCCRPCFISYRYGQNTSADTWRN
jgi:hypothetical protein